MQILLDRAAPEPLYQQIAAFIEHQIGTGTLRPGALLPSIRALAQRLAVSKTVAAMAYAELEARGRVAGRVGQGTVVTPLGSDSARRPRPALALPDRAPGGAVLRDLVRLAQQPGLINFGISSPSMEHLPAGDFGRCLRAVLQQDGAAAYGYEQIEGYRPLREAIARHLMGRGMATTADEVLVTTGAQQAIDLTLRALAAPGEWVVTEGPCYTGALEAFHLQRVRVATAPVDAQGLVVDALEPLFRELRPRLLYTTPSFQNPTGTTLSLERRRRLVELATRWGVTILEDGVCSELELCAPAPPALWALGGPIVHCGSFSKGLLPGIRLGYAVADVEMIRRLTVVKQASDINSPGLLQRALARFLDAGHFAPHLRRVLAVYRRRREAVLQALQRYLPEGSRWTEPAGGFHLWVTLPPEADVTPLYLAAIEAGIVFAPGQVFFPAPAPSRQLRLSYGAVPTARIETGIAGLGALLARPPLRAGARVPARAASTAAAPAAAATATAPLEPAGYPHGWGILAESAG
jgi:GntR family transcriptional regulator/MocR family aminotransferase